MKSGAPGPAPEGAGGGGVGGHPTSVLRNGTASGMTECREAARHRPITQDRCQPNRTCGWPKTCCALELEHPPLCRESAGSREPRWRAPFAARHAVARDDDRRRVARQRAAPTFACAVRRLEADRLGPPRRSSGSCPAGMSTGRRVDRSDGRASTSRAGRAGCREGPGLHRQGRRSSHRSPGGRTRASGHVVESSSPSIRSSFDEGRSTPTIPHVPSIGRRNARARSRRGTSTSSSHASICGTRSRPRWLHRATREAIRGMAGPSAARTRDSAQAHIMPDAASTPDGPSSLAATGAGSQRAGPESEAGVTSVRRDQLRLTPSDSR